MERKQLESAAANYPFLHVQGLYAIPVGIIWFLTGLSNLQEEPVQRWIVGGGVLLCLVALLGIARFYQHYYGRVTLTRNRQTRYFVAFAIGFAVYVGADQLGRTILGRPPGQPVSTVAAAWALGMLVFYAATVGLKSHHMVIWGALLVAGLLPIWGHGVDRDALAAFPIGVATIASGLFDHRLLARMFGSSGDLRIENSNVGP